MRAELISTAGVPITLPEPLRYQLLYTDGESADSFSLSLPTGTDWLSRLRGCGELRCLEGERLLFRGVLDEAEAVMADAFTTTLCGRGLAARLMDNQVEGAEFYHLDLETVLARYVRPFGIDRIRVEGGPWRGQLLRIPTGCSCYQVLQGFCRHAGAPQPKFLPDGTLYIGSSRADHSLGPEACLRAGWRFCRYGVRSRQKVIDLSRHSSRLAENPALAAWGIASQGVATRSGPFTTITERSPWQRLAASARELETLELLLPGSHPAQAGDRMQVSLPALGVDGWFTIIEICRQFDGRQESTQLLLRAQEG